MKFADANLHIAECRHGQMLYNRNCQWIGQSMAVYGEYSEQEVDVFAQLIQPGDVVLEIGTNIGVHAVPLAKLCAPGQFYGFEPQRELCKIANTNLLLNGCNNGHVLDYGIGSRNHIAQISEPDYNVAGNFGGISIPDSDGHGRNIEIRSMDSLKWIDKLDFIKMDVEGMEIDVLTGALKTIAKHRPIIYTENDRKDKSKHLIAKLISMKYDCYWHLPNLYSKDNFFKSTINMFPNIVSLNMLCIPVERDIKVSNFQVADESNYWMLAE